MKTIISVVLIVIIAFLTWALIQGIKEPIAFQEVKEARKAAVVSKLEKIRSAQEYFREIYQETFDEILGGIKSTVTVQILERKFSMLSDIGDYESTTKSNLTDFELIQWYIYQVVREK